MMTVTSTEWEAATVNGLSTSDLARIHIDEMHADGERARTAALVDPEPVRHRVGHLLVSAGRRLLDA